MAEHLALMAAHLRLLSQRQTEKAKAGATLLQARAHLDDRTWDRWVTEEVGLEVEQARQLMAAAELAGASVETLRPPEI